MYCTSCGAANAAGARVCGQCGTPAAHAAPLAAPATQAASARHGGAWWAAVGIGAILLAALAPALFSFPWRSLMDSSDGATLVGDAALGLLLGGAALGGGLFALHATARDQDSAAPWVIGGIAGLLGLFGALVLTGEAHRLAHTTIVNGLVEGRENIFIATAMLSLLSLIALGIAMIPPGDRRQRFLLAGAALAVLAGAALFVACAWTVVNAGDLQAAAAARTRRETPNAALLLMLSSLSLATWLRGRGS